jgi:hypothetical protein
MSKRHPSGFISAFYDPLKNPDAPTIGTATAGDASASVPFTAPANVGGSAITGYGVQSTPEGIKASAASSPISITGLTNGTAYTFAVWALNTYGPSAFSAASNSVTPQAAIGLFAGVNAAGGNTIARITIASTGDATDFGDLTSARQSLAGFASSTRGCFAGGSTENTIDYVTIASAGNATDFGDLTEGKNVASGGCNSSTRGLIGGGNNGVTYLNVIEYVTIATTGNALDFGDITVQKNQVAACSSPTRGLFSGGAYPGGTQIDYVTIATTGNAVTFGNLTVGRYGHAGCSSSVRGLFGGGGSSAIGNVIDYVTIATTGNAVDFGDLTIEHEGTAACSSSARGVFGGSYGPNSNVISYVTIASTGNAIDFGDLTVGGYRAGCSNSNGGVQ